MKKILPAIAGILFSAFLVGMFGLVISLTFSALGRIFPDNFTNQIIGLVLFDIAALAWGLAFVYKSESVGQYAFAAIGFLVGLAGTLAMIASEVMLSAQDLTTPPPWIGNVLVYGFVGAAAFHLVLGYLHKAASPDVDASIRLGAARAEVVSEAIQQAELELEHNRAVMGSIIKGRLVAEIKRDLRLPLAQDDAEALAYQPDIIEAKPKANGGGVPAFMVAARKIFKRKAARPEPVTTTYESAEGGPGAAAPAPFQNRQPDSQS